MKEHLRRFDQAEATPRNGATVTVVLQGQYITVRVMAPARPPCPWERTYRGQIISGRLPRYYYVGDCLHFRQGHIKQ